MDERRFATRPWRLASLWSRDSPFFLTVLTRVQNRFAEERLTRMQALRGFTNAPAYAAYQEAEVGSLEVGKKADIVIFDRDLLHCPANELLEAKAVATIVGGRLMYGSLR